jgi:hypothetical protein
MMIEMLGIFFGNARDNSFKNLRIYAFKLAYNENILICLFTVTELPETSFFSCSQQKL